MLKSKIVLTKLEEGYVVSETGFNLDQEVQTNSLLKCIEFYPIHLGKHTILFREDSLKQVRFGSMKEEISKSIINVVPKRLASGRVLFNLARDSAIDLAHSRGYTFEDLTDQQV